MQVLTDLDYCTMLDEGVELAESAFKSAKGTWQASVLEKRLVTLRTLRSEYNARRLDGALRYAPFAIYIFGPSGVGKSTLAGGLDRDWETQHPHLAWCNSLNRLRLAFCPGIELDWLPN